MIGCLDRNFSIRLFIFFFFWSAATFILTRHRSQTILSTIRPLGLVNKTGKKGELTRISIYHFPCVFTSFFVLFFFELASSMNLEKASRIPSTNVKRPCMHTLDLSCAAPRHPLPLTGNETGRNY